MESIKIYDVLELPHMEVSRSKFNRISNELLRKIISQYPDHEYLRMISAIVLTDIMLRGMFRDYTLDHFINKRISEFVFTWDFQDHLIIHGPRGYNYHENDSVLINFTFTRSHKGEFIFNLMCSCTIVTHSETDDPEINIKGTEKISARIDEISLGPNPLEPSIKVIHSESL